MLSMAGLAEEAGLQSLNNSNNDDDIEHRNKKKEEKRYFELLQLLTETEYILQDFIEQIDYKLLQATKELQQYKDMLAERIALEQCIAVLKNDGLIERYTDGSLKDKHLERAVTLYLKDKRMSLDLTDDAKIYAIAQNIIDDYPTEKQLAEVIDIQINIIDTYRMGKNKAMELQQRLNNQGNLSELELREISEQVDSLERDVHEKSSAFIDMRESVFTLDDPEALPVSTLSFELRNQQNTLAPSNDVTDTLPPNLDF